jgi:hypothetical protein
VTSAELSRWLDEVRRVAALEAARWKSIRMPDDLTGSAVTIDRVRLHAVGTLLAAIGKLAGVAGEHLDALRPPSQWPPCRCVAAAPPPGPWHSPTCQRHRPIAYSDGA